MRIRFSRRRRLGRLVAAAGLALVAGGSAASAVARGNDLARTYGTRTAVVVATHDLDPGSTVTDADLRTVDRPDALVVGTRVDVVAVLLDSGRATRTASAGVVVAIDDDAITVAVAPDEVSATARAALDGTAVLALRTD
jgi:hypothetical protein